MSREAGAAVIVRELEVGEAGAGKGEKRENEGK